MDFVKFTALIQNRSLYFPSLKQFLQTDPWEGLPSNLNFDPTRPIEVYENNEVPRCQNGTRKLTTLSQFLGNGFENIIKHQKQAYIDLRKTFYVSCWHMNDGESDSQWKIYGYNPMSLAIVTNFQKLSESITDSRTIYGGKVIYYNPERDITSEGNVYYQAIMKRTAFEHEKEFRLIFWDHQSINNDLTSEGVSIAVDIENLIERIIISPHAPEWFLKVVTSLTNDYGFNIQIEKSNLLDPLIY